MRKNLLELIVCPVCAGALSLESFDAQSVSSADETESGLLRCACGASYPIIGGIPRLLPADLQSMLWEMHPEFYSEHGKHLPEDALPQEVLSKNAGETDKALTKQKETARSFGYEWQAFSEILPEDYEKNFLWYFERFSPADFRGKRVLDAGCGTGRHTYYVSKTAREVIAMDLSQAIEVAARNNRAHTNAHFVQADIYRPPFRPGTFDFIYSLGVLHHLPEPEKGFRSLLKLLRKGGFMNIYLYWNLEGEAAWRRALLGVVTAARRVTTRMPHNLLKKVSWLIAAGFEVAFVTPARVLGRFSSTSGLADRVPLGHYRKYSFRVLHTDQFDRFSAPIENRYSSAEVAEWFERAGLVDVKILGGQGWRASGRSAGRETKAAQSVEEEEQVVS
ncbi:MAG TPA: methyltransferase domain-containing protein [Pyrinomonadaceae bacterium]|nr:methyltransferase domain-containing protein [Pyrinomonadaceae bacterium]